MKSAYSRVFSFLPGGIIIKSLILSLIFNTHFIYLNFVIEPGTQRNEDIVPYDGAQASAQKEYNFCNICKEKLEVEQDKQDESWYFVNAKAIKSKAKDELNAES
jgi:hypothetical protein